MKIVTALSLFVITIFMFSSIQTSGNTVDGLYFYADFEFNFDTANAPERYYSNGGFTARGFNTETDRVMTHPDASHEGKLGLSIKSHIAEEWRPFSISTEMNVEFENDTILSLWVYEVMGETSMRITITDDLDDFINIDYIGPVWDSWEEGSTNIYDVKSEVPQNEWYHIERNIADDVDLALKTGSGILFNTFEPKYITMITFFQDHDDTEFDNEFYVDTLAIEKEGTVDKLFADNSKSSEWFVSLYLYVWVLPVFVLFRRKIA